MRSCIGAILAFLLLVGNGCRLGPSYQPPAVCVPDTWKTPVQTSATVSCVEQWWEVFQDDTLCTLEASAVENSPSLGQALSRVMEARSVVELNRSALFPQITFNPSYADSGQLFKLYLPQGVIPFPNPNLSVFRIHQFQYVLPLNLNYEIDLWGKLRGQYESAVYAAQAQDEDYLNLMLTLTTDVASNYFQLRQLDEQIAILKATIDGREANQAVNEARYKKGIGNALDVASASLETSNAESNYYDALRQRAIIENVLAVLVGQAPSDFYIEPQPLAGLPPEVPGGVPSIVLLQRPDIAGAERTCASQHAQIGVAYASFFPSLSLTGTLGYSSPDLTQFLKWISRLWAIGANGAQTVFDAGYTEANAVEAWARFAEASYAYQQLVLTAFQDVENALASLQYQAKQYGSLQDGVAAARLRYHLSLQRYQKGLTNYLEVVDSEDAALAAELSLANLRGQRYLSTVQLIKALGGGWEACNSSYRTIPEHDTRISAAG